MMSAFLIFLGGGFGAVCRHLVGLGGMRLLGPGFPYGTLTVNIVGSLVMGLLIGWLVRHSGTSPDIRLFAATGFLGGFTTFSAFSLDTANLWMRGEIAATLFYVLASVILSIAAVFIGLAIMRVSSL